MIPPLVVAYGMGVDSTAMLVGFAARGIRPDLILFGGFVRERDSEWLRKFLKNGGGLCPECDKLREQKEVS